MSARAGLALGVSIIIAAIAVSYVLGIDDQRFGRERLPTPVRPHAVSVAQKGTTTVRTAPPDVRAAAREWPLPNHDYGNTRATTTTAIDARTVGRLGAAWYR